jgi:hypothetical protein
MSPGLKSGFVFMVFYGPLQYLPTTKILAAEFLPGVYGALHKGGLIPTQNEKPPKHRCIPFALAPQRPCRHAAGMNSTEFRAAIDTLPYGKRLPGAVYLIDPGDDPRIPPLLRITTAELRKRLEISPEFNLLKFHTASPKISFLAYPDFEKLPHPVLREAVIVDLVTGKIRRDAYHARANPPILHRKETFLPPEHPLHDKFSKLTRQEESAGLLDDTARTGSAEEENPPPQDRPRPPRDFQAGQNPARTRPTPARRVVFRLWHRAGSCRA